MYDETWPKTGRAVSADPRRTAPHAASRRILHLEKALDWIDRLSPTRAVLTNMHIDLDHDTVAAETADHIDPAYDGMTLTLEL